METTTRRHISLKVALNELERSIEEYKSVANRYIKPHSNSVDAKVRFGFLICFKVLRGLSSTFQRTLVHPLNSLPKRRPWYHPEFQKRLSALKAALQNYFICLRSGACVQRKTAEGEDQTAFKIVEQALDEFEKTDINSHSRCIHAVTIRHIRAQWEAFLGILRKRLLGGFKTWGGNRDLYHFDLDEYNPIKEAFANASRHFAVYLSEAYWWLLCENPPRFFGVQVQYPDGVGDVRNGTYFDNASGQEEDAEDDSVPLFPR